MIDISDKKLESLGLPLMQARVYIAALQLGQASMQSLSRKSGVSRSTIYTFIEELKAQGYLFETKNGKRRVYTAANPEHVVDTQRDRIQALEDFLPELQAINNTPGLKPKVTYYEGMQGIKEVYLEILRTGEDIVSYEDIQHLKEGLPKDIYNRIPRERAAKNIRLTSISRDTPLAREYCEKNKDLLRQTKFIKDDDFKTEIKIYANNIALINLRGEVPFCVLIENKHLADTMRMLWKQLWDRID